MFNFLSIKNNEIVLIPLAYNTFIYKLKNSKKMPVYEKDISLQDEFIVELKEYINKIYMQDKTVKIVLDFNNIVFCNRAFESYNGNEFLKNLIFSNFKSNDLLITSRLCDCIEGLQKENDGYSIDANNIKSVTKMDYKKIYSEYVCEIFENNNVIENNDVKFLDSSGIYSSTYIHINRIFYSFDSYMFIIYRIAEDISNFGINKIDALISTSKTGGIIATLVGKILDKKVIHCFGLGPKNTSTKNIFEKIRKGNKYYVVCDFVCIGTEIKTLNTIITLSKAKLIGGISVASYIDLSSEKYNDSILKRITTLINTKTHNINYKISGFCEDIQEGKNE